MKRFRMFAGPNGSGKSTLIEDIKKHYNVGYFVNADIIEKQLKTQGFINCEEYVPTPMPQFAFFANLPQYVKDPYRRFIENKLRENFDFNGVPIDVYFRQK